MTTTATRGAGQAPPPAPPSPALKRLNFAVQPADCGGGYQNPCRPPDAPQTRSWRALRGDSGAGAGETPSPAPPPPSQEPAPHPPHPPTASPRAARGASRAADGAGRRPTPRPPRPTLRGGTPRALRGVAPTQWGGQPATHPPHPTQACAVPSSFADACVRGGARVGCRRRASLRAFPAVIPAVCRPPAPTPHPPAQRNSLPLPRGG